MKDLPSYSESNNCSFVEFSEDESDVSRETESKVENNGNERNNKLYDFPQTSTYNVPSTSDCFDADCSQVVRSSTRESGVEKQQLTAYAQSDDHMEQSGSFTRIVVKRYGGNTYLQMDDECETLDVKIQHSELADDISRDPTSNARQSITVLNIFNTKCTENRQNQIIDQRKRACMILETRRHSTDDQSPLLISNHPDSVTEKFGEEEMMKRRRTVTTTETVESSPVLEADAVAVGDDKMVMKAAKRCNSTQDASDILPKVPRYEFEEKKFRLQRKQIQSKIESSYLERLLKCSIATTTETDLCNVMPDGKAPHFPQQPVARQNDDGSLELECFVDANPTPQVKWYYDNKEVENSGRFSANLANKGSDSYSAILTIKELADADAGAYRCAIVNPHGKGNANFNLKLTGFSSPTFVEKPQISSRDDGQVMVMEFRAKSILEPTFVWQKLVGGGAEEIIANSDRIKAVKKLEAGNVYYSALEIKEPTKDKDAGQFICTVKNESGKLTATFTVKFEVPEGAPSFTRKPQILQQTSSGGEPAICFDIGYSARMNPQVTWISPKSKKMKESSRIKFKTNDEGNGNFTAQLELTNYKAKDSGTYTCNIKNDAGEANVELTLNIEGPLDDYADDSEN